jgi:inosose dehydratase
VKGQSDRPVASRGSAADDLPMIQPIAIQSWCFKAFPGRAELFEKLRECGVTATEVCGVHGQFDRADTAEAFAAEFKAAGITPVCIGVETMTGDEARDRPRFEFCRRAGIPNMSIHFQPSLMDDNFAGLRRVERLAEEHGLQLGIHNHGGYDWLGNETILKHVFAHVGPRIGLHMDTAWAIDAKFDPTRWLETFGDRVVGVHVKDFVYDRKRQFEDVVIGTGCLDLAAFCGELRRREFAGPLVIEYEGNFEHPVPALSECVQRLVAAMA